MYKRPVHNLAVHGESARVFVEVNSGDAGNRLGLLDVGAVAADCETHQLVRHSELLAV